MIAAVGKGLRVAGKIALWALAIVALLVGLTWTFLQTRRGGELVRRLALPRVNAALAGHLAVGKLAFGGDRLTLENLALHDPDGELVARVARIDVRFSPLALLRRHVEVSAVDIRRPEVTLVADERGLNLSRALAPRHPAAAAPAPAGPATSGGGGAGPKIDLRALLVSDGSIDYRAPDGAGDRHVHLAELAIRGRASLADDVLVADVVVGARGARVEARGTFAMSSRRGRGAVHAELRGLDVSADGRIDGDGIAGRARIVADDLAATARSLARNFDLPRPPMAGNGRIDVELGGTTAAPSLRVAARFPLLEAAGTRARDLTLAAWIPDLTVPEAADVDAAASAVTSGAQRLRAPILALHAAGRTVTLHAAIAAPEPLRVDLTGRREAKRVIAIDALTLRYPEATWALRRRARLALGDTIVLSGFELAAGGQRLAADVRSGGGRTTAHLVVAGLDLSRLPRALVPPAAGLGGAVDADVDVRADAGATPRVTAKVKLAGGRVGRYRDLALELDGKLDRARASGQLHARGMGLAADARFDVPAVWPPRNPRAPLALDLQVADTDLGAVAKAIAEAGGTPPARLKGRARVSLQLDGRIGRPRLRLTVAGRGLAIDDHQIGDLSLAVNGEGDGSLAAQLTSVAPARTRIDVTTPLSLHALLHRPPTAAALMRTPFTVKGTIDRVPLAVLAHAAGRTEHVAGTLSSTISITGTAAAPEGTVGVDIAGAALDRFPPTDARLELTFADRSVEARARVVRRGAPLLAAESRVDAPLGDLLRPAALAAAPVRLRAVFGPYTIQRLGLPPLSEREPPRELKGRLHADLSLDGTLATPRVVFHAQANDVRLDKTLVGYAQIEASYANRRAGLDARLTSQNGGSLHAVGSMTADLGYPAVTRGFDARRVPIDARFEAQGFDVQGLSGAVQELRSVGGLLTAALTIRGTVADPRVAGRLEWKDGELAVTGFGAYKGIHLALHGDASSVVLDELAGASGSGKARVTGTAKHRDDGKGYDVAAHAKLDRFPIYSQGQALAVVSVASRVNGRGSPLDTRLSVDIDDAHIELTDAKRKELQSLTPPADVVLVDGQQPLNAAQAAKLNALLQPARAAAPATAPGAPHLRLKINAPRQLWVQGKDAKLELGLSPDFRVSIGDRTQIFGQVTLHRGRVDVFGRRFDIKSDSTLTFGGAPDRPELDVRAEHRNDAEKITVLLTAKGPIDKLAVSVSAPERPELTESQLYTMIITGHLQLGGGTSGASPSAQAASILGGVLASKLQSTLAHRLPLDVLTIDTGGEGLMGTKLEAGRYVTDRFYVGYIGRVGSDPTRYQNRNAVHLEYQLTSRWEVEGEYGDLGTGTADLVWKKNY